MCTTLFHEAFSSHRSHTSVFKANKPQYVTNVYQHLQKSGKSPGLLHSLKKYQFHNAHIECCTVQEFKYNVLLRDSPSFAVQLHRKAAFGSGFCTNKPSDAVLANFIQNYSEVIRLSTTHRSAAAKFQLYFVDQQVLQESYGATIAQLSCQLGQNKQRKLLCRLAKTQNETFVKSLASIRKQKLAKSFFMYENVKLHGIYLYRKKHQCRVSTSILSVPARCA